MASAMSHATSAEGMGDIAPPPNHIATSQNSPQETIMLLLLSFFQVSLTLVSLYAIPYRLLGTLK